MQSHRRQNLHQRLLVLIVALKALEPSCGTKVVHAIGLWRSQPSFACRNGLEILKVVKSMKVPLKSRAPKQFDMSVEILDSRMRSYSTWKKRSVRYEKLEEDLNPKETHTSELEQDMEVSSSKAVGRQSRFEPLTPPKNRQGPPPDFEMHSYAQGWGLGKKRKLVNVDVVESMRQIAIYEMNRKDREIFGLNEQLEADSRTMEHLQLELEQERSKRLHMERENAVLQGQVSVLMDMVSEDEEQAMEEEEEEEAFEGVVS